MQYIKYIIAVCIIIIIIIIAIYTSNVIVIPFGICIFGLLGIDIYYNIIMQDRSKHSISSHIGSINSEKIGTSEKSTHISMKKTLLDNWYYLHYVLYYQSYPHVTSKIYRLLATLKYHYTDSATQYKYLGNQWILRELSTPPIINKTSIDQLNLVKTKFSKKYKKSIAFLYQQIINIKESFSFIYTITIHDYIISSVVSSNKVIPDEVITLLKYIAVIVDTCVYVPSTLLHKDIIKQYKICFIRLDKDKKSDESKHTGDTQIEKTDNADMYNEYLIVDWIPQTISVDKMKFNIPISTIQTSSKNITYVFDIPRLDQRHFLSYTISNKWRRIDIDIAGKIDYIIDLHFYDSTRYGTAISKMQARVKSHLSDIEDLSNKVILHKLIMENPKLHKYIPESITILHQKTNPDNKNIKVVPTLTEPWIWRPAFSSSGWGIEIITSKAELEAVIDKYEYLNKKYMFVLSRYITNPKLIKNPENGLLYKFHVRLHIIISIDKYDTTRFFLVNTGEILIASNPYVNQDYNNKKIHDTHSKSSKYSGRFFPDDLPGTEHEKDKIITDIRTMFKDIFNTNIPYKLKKADKCESSFHIFGMDVMITDENKPILIEINKYPGLPTYIELPYRTYVTRLSKEFYSGLWDMVINPLVTDAPMVENHEYITLLTTIKP